MAQISEQERDNITKESKKILDNFASKLNKITLKKKKEDSIVGGFREEGAGARTDADFRERIFVNASNKNEDAIIAEKKKW